MNLLTENALAKLNVHWRSLLDHGDTDALHEYMVVTAELSVGEQSFRGIVDFASGPLDMPPYTRLDSRNFGHHP